MADDGSRDFQFARPAGAENPLHPTFTFTASESDIESLVRSWNEDIVRAARTFVARDRSLSDEAAEECAQAARLALARVAHRADEVGAFYLRRVIQNAVRDAARRERRIYGRSSPLDKASINVAAEVSDELPEDAVSRVAEWAAKLPGRLKQIYDLLYLRGWTQRAAAAEMGVSQPRIAQLHRELLTRGKAELQPLAA
ncbi:MAG: sigma-70 family RNA polymerase sigma factor [Gemmatimonadaceae bacterium]|nr:sigma-70 family RNA polymerase sigma factor [Gemmatimonadaceae bacterium]